MAHSSCTCLPDTPLALSIIDAKGRSLQTHLN
jgi:hypothetical protein